MLMFDANNNYLIYCGFKIASIKIKGFVAFISVNIQDVHARFLVQGWWKHLKNLVR